MSLLKKSQPTLFLGEPWALYEDQLDHIPIEDYRPAQQLTDSTIVQDKKIRRNEKDSGYSIQILAAS